MPEGMNRYRISVLVIDDRAGFCQVVVELLADGLSAAQVGVLGAIKTLDDMVEAAVTPAEVRRLLAGEWQPLGQPGGLAVPERVEGRCGGDLGKVLASAGHGANGQAWMDATQARRLAGEVERGALVLLASASTAEQHARIGRILLRHGRHDLQTHEFSRPRASAN